MHTSSTMSYNNTTIPGAWDHHRNQYTPQQHLQLEIEDPYLLDASQDTSQSYMQPQRGTSGTQHLVNRSLPPSQYHSLASNRYDSASASGSGFQQQQSLPASSMSPVASAFTFTQQGYNTNSPQSGYQSSFVSSMNASTATAAHSPASATSASPSGPGYPMQFPYTLPPSTRQSDLMSQVMSQMTAAAMAHQPAAPKRQRAEDDIEELPEPEEHQDHPDPAGKPRP